MSATNENKMKKLESVLSKYKSLYKASKATGVHAQQLSRWIENGAYINSDGEIYIKTKSKDKLKGLKND